VRRISPAIRTGATVAALSFQLQVVDTLWLKPRLGTGAWIMVLGMGLGIPAPGVLAVDVLLTSDYIMAAAKVSAEPQMNAAHL